jgi:hypothetical protein
MNLRQSDADLRLQMQQLEGAPTCVGKRPPSPFAAALGIGVVVLLVWLLFALGSIIGQLVALGREAAEFALSLFCSSCSAP